MLAASSISVTIARDWRSLYEEYWRPEAFARWASGLSSAGLREEDGIWVGDGPEGLIRVRFTDHNPYGIMDHWVEIGTGRESHVPLRIIQNGKGAEIVLTLYRQPDLDDARFAADAAWVRRDLLRLKDLAEQDRIMGAGSATGEPAPQYGAKADDLAVRRLVASDIPAAREMLDLFADAFGDDATYRSHRPSADYFRQLLASEGVIALIACAGGRTVGALVAYELPKFEQERSEIYIYDLAVAAAYRRQGIATSLINALKGVARDRGAWVMFIQADYGDGPAIALYEKLGAREDVIHFDIAIEPYR